MTHTPKLGVIVIAQNEERDLPPFLENCLHWVDELVLVDDGSTDRTLEIASSAGSKVRIVQASRQRLGGFAELRNVGIRESRSEWLLHMDVDVRVPPNLASEILASILDRDKEGYRVKRKNYFLGHPMSFGGWGGWNEMWLARRRYEFEGKLHERIQQPAEARIGQLKEALWHLTDEDYVERVRKNMGYMQIEADAICARGPVRMHSLLLAPAWRAFKSLVLRQGFRDGAVGLFWAFVAYYTVFNYYATAWARQHTVSRSTLEKQMQDMWKTEWPHSGGLQ